MGLFGKKVACFECNKKVKEKVTVFRRHMRFCSHTCMDTHVTANPVRPAPGGDADAHLREAKIRLDSALAALKAAMGGQGGVSVDMGGASAMLAVQAMEESTGALHQFDQLVLEALPYLYALGRGGLAEQLETIDLEPLHGMSALGAGPAQRSRVVKALEPVAARVLAVVSQL